MPSPPNARRQPPEDGAAPNLRTLLVIPAFNERGNIGLLLKEIAALDIDCDTLVVDDGSMDSTAAEASEYVEVLSLPDNLGVGAAVQAGIREGLRRGYDIVIQVDGDGQHPPHQIAALLRAHRETGAELVIGSRFVQGLRSQFQSTLPRRLGSRAVSAALYVLFQQEFTDPTSGFRLMSRDAMRLFSEHYPVDFPEPVTIGLALREGLRVREVAVEMRPRVFGESAFRGMRGLVYMSWVLSDVVRVRMGAPGEGLPERTAPALGQSIRSWRAAHRGAS